MSEKDDEEKDLIEIGGDDDGEDEDEDASILARKYSDEERQIFPQKIELPISTLPQMVKEQINLSPEFQRRDVWDQKKQSKFIESLIMNVPVPAVFLGEDTYGNYVVLDGRQRLTAIVKYMNNEYSLAGLRVWPELNGFQYHQLAAKRLDVTLRRRFIPAVVLLKESTPEVKYDVFERLNTGGLNLQAMEIRNAIYRGPFTQLLHACAASKGFRKLWDIPASEEERKDNAVFKRMRDLELVLRFFALSAAQAQRDRKRPAFKTYLGIFMQSANECCEKDPSQVDRYKDQFDRAVANCLSVFGERAFVGSKGGGARSAPLADALMYAMALLSPEQLASVATADAVRAAREVLLHQNAEFAASLKDATNGRAKIEHRLEAARIAFEKAVKDGSAR